MYPKTQRDVCLYLAMILLLLAGGYARAQKTMASYHVARYSNENGLPQNSVKAIAVDEYGFVWLATEAGLVRFDGRHFYLFNKFNAGIVSSRIVDIWRSPVNGELHALTDRWNMLRISNGNTHVAQGNWAQLYNRVRPFSRTSAGIYPTWRYGNWTDPYHLDSLQLNLSNHEAVLLTRNGRVNWFYRKKLTGSRQLPSVKQFNTFFVLGNALYQINNVTGNVQEVRKTGLVQVALSGDMTREQKTGGFYLCVNQAAKQAFVYTDKQFYAIGDDGHGGLTTTLLLQGLDFEQLRISSGYYDTSHKRLFLGSYTSGLYVFTPKIFVSRTHTEAPDRDNVFYDLVTMNDTSVLTGKSLLFSAGTERYTVLPGFTGTTLAIGSRLYKARDSTIWTADQEQVYQFSPDAGHIIARRSIAVTTAIMQLSDGTMWMGTDKKGIYTFDPLQQDKKAELLLPNKDFVTFMKQQDDRVWIGTDRSLMCYHLATRKIDTIKQLDYKVVRSIYVSGKHEVWLCTYEDGLYLYRDGKLTRFPADRTGAMNTVHAIVEDKNGYFWIPTNNGIFQVSRTDLLRYADDKSKVPYYLHYNKTSGFNTNEFNGGSQQVIAQLAEGFFALASMDGVVFFKPGAVRPELPDAPVIVDRLELDGKAIALNDSVVLRPGFTTFRVRVATPYFGNPDNVILEYRLDDENWSMMENETFALNALDAGDHRLTIRKRSGFNDHYQYRAIRLRVNPAFYETHLFRAFCVLLAVLLIWMFLRLRLRLLNRRNRYLEQIVADRTYDLKEIIHALEISEQRLGSELYFQEKLSNNIAHDIRTPLKYLVLFSKYLQSKIEKSELPEVDEVEGISMSAERIYNYTDKLTSYLKARMVKDQRKSLVNLKDVVRQNADIFLLALKEQHTEVRNEVAPGLSILTHPQLFDMLIHNLMDNAVKNTSDGTITVTAEEDDGYLIVRMADTGKGMSQHEADIYNRYFVRSDDSEADNEQYTGLGFSIVKDILPMLNISIHISPGASGGTCFTLHMLAEKARQQLDGGMPEA